MRRGLVMGSCCIALVAALTAGLMSPLEPRPARAEPAARGVMKLVSRGVNATRIKIGLHAPITGASPVASDSVERGKDLFFRWLESQGRSIHGRDVEVVLRNDQFNPSTAVSVCREMVEEEKVFLLMGFQGVDQMQACARYAASKGVPYVSPGSTRIVLNQLDNYFAASKTYRGEGRLLADFFITKLRARNRENGVVYYDSPNWRQGRDAFSAEMERRGAEIAYDRTVPVGAGASEAQLVVQEMKLAGIQNVFIIGRPVWFMNVLKQADAQDFFPQWTGISTMPANDAVANVSCRGGNSLDGARFLSPYPAVVDSDRFDPRFRKAVTKLHPQSTPDDYMWHLWALQRVVGKMLDGTGKDLTATRFIRRTERRDRLATGILPTLRYSPSDHFGARDAHLLKARCADRKWHTVRSFVHDFKRR